MVALSLLLVAQLAAPISDAAAPAPEPPAGEAVDAVDAAADAAVEADADDAEPFVLWTSTETVRARFQTGLRDPAAPAVYPSPARTGLLEGNERFRLQTAENGAALAGDLSVYLQSNDNAYQAVPNEAYVDLAPADWFGANLGRRRLVYGSGFAVNPMDWLNVGKDPLNPLDQRVGAYVALAEAHGATWALTGIYSPDVASERHGLPDDMTPDAYTALVRAYALVAETDVNVQVGRDHAVPRAGASFARYFFDVYEGHAEVSARRGSDQLFLNPVVRRFLAAQPATSAAPASLPAGAPSPFVAPFSGDDRWFVRALAGTRYTFDSGDMITLEYFWNGEGYTRGQWNERIDLLRRLPAGASALLPQGGASSDPSKKFNLAFQRRNYAFVTGSLRTFGTTGWLEDLGGNLAVTANLDPAVSALVYPSLSFRRGDHARLGAGVAVPIGSPTSEFGSLPFREQYVFETSLFF